MEIGGALSVSKLVIAPLPFIEWVLERYNEYTAKSEGGDASGALIYISEHDSLTLTILKGVPTKKIDSTIMAILCARAVLAFNAGMILTPPLMGGGGGLRLSKNKKKLPTKILNPKTGRYVLRQGRIGAQIMMAPVALRKKR